MQTRYKCIGRSILVKNIDFVWIWKDEMDANSFKENARFLEGSVDILADD